MTTSETVPKETVPEVAVYHTPPVSSRREELAAGVADLSLAPVTVAPADRYGEHGEDVAVVFGDGTLEAVDRPTVRVSTDPAVLRGAADRAVDTIHWGLGDDWEVLAARLEATVEAIADRPTLTEEDADGADFRSYDPSLYEYLVETVGDAVYILDEEGHFVFVNDALCEMTGHSREELLGSSVHIIKEDHTVEEAEDALRELLRERTTPGGEDEGVAIAKLDVDLVPTDGDRIPATDRMTLRPLEDGEFAGTVGTLRDISRQRRRQNVLGGIIDETQEMMAATDETAVADLIVETAVEVFGIDLAVVRKYDPDAEELALLAQSTEVREVMGGRPEYQPLDSVIGTSFAEDRLIVEPDVPSAVEGVEEVSAGLFCPIGDRYVLGLGRQSGDESGSTDDERQFVEVLANTAAAAFDRVRREEDLRQYEAIVEAADEMLFTLDETGRFTLVTRPFARMLGRERPDLVGRTLSDFVAHPDAIEAALEQETAIETAFETPDGEVPARLTLSPFAGSYETGTVGTVRDISRLKSAQREASRQRRRFTELFETLSDPVADVVYEDGVATVESVNPAFAELCDAGARTLQGSTLVAAQNALPEALSAALDPVQSPEPNLDRSVTASTDSGERHYLLRTVPYGEETDRAFVILTDVTELKRRGTHLKVLHRLLRHNLRNETTLIQGYAEQLLDLDTDGAVDEYAARILDASAELVRASETSRTVQRVLSMSDETIESTPAPEALDYLATELDSDPDRGASVDLVVDGVDATTVPFSHYLLVALSELVTNADEHTDTETVEVSAVETEEGLRIAVADDGPGLPDGQWEVLMGDREITQLQHGDGLGLWLVKWVVERHNGRLTLERADETGTTVAVELPAQG